METRTCLNNSQQSQAGEAPPSTPMRHGVWSLMRPIRFTIWAAILLSAVGSICGLLGIASLALVINALLNQSSTLWVWFFLALGLISANFILSVCAFTISHLGAFRLEIILRTRLTEHLARIPLGYLLLSGSGSLAKILQEDVKALHSFVADSTPLIGRSAATPVITFALLLFIDWKMALVALGVLVIGFVLMQLAMRDSAVLRSKYEEERERINSAVVEFVQAMPVVRTFDDGKASFGRYQSALDGFRNILKHWIKVAGGSAKLGIIALAPLPTLVTLTVVGLIFYQKGDLEFSRWAAILLLGTGMAESFTPIMWLNNFIRKARSSAIRIQDLEAVPTLPISTNPQEPKGIDLCFDSVCFAYESRDDDALRQVSFEVPEGSITALVGPSGAGKSTVARLIPRFWDVRSGSIRLGGVDIREMSSETLLGHVSFVFQDNFLFHDSIAANIRMGNPDAPMQAVIEAAKAAQAHEFIMELPDGYETMAGDRGTRLSGGQRQRITIARAILQDCPMVVLDEATAFADPENEAALVKALANLMKGRTVIIIAHRLSTIRGADQIIVLDNGEVAERGKHDALVQNGGVYARLWSNYGQAQKWTLGASIHDEQTNKGEEVHGK